MTGRKTVKNVLFAEKATKINMIGHTIAKYVGIVKGHAINLMFGKDVNAQNAINIEMRNIFGLIACAKYVEKFVMNNMIFLKIVKNVRDVVQKEMLLINGRKTAIPA